MIPAQDQERMAQGLTDVARIETGHSPFLSTPGILAEHLIEMGT